jgi:Spy/CpxP family protein refolding chaperone
LVAFTCINLLTPEQMNSLEAKLNERREKLKKERNDESN